MIRDSFTLVPSDTLNKILQQLDKLENAVLELTLKLEKKTQPSNTRTLLTRSELGSKLKVSLPTIDKWKNNGIIKFKRVGRRIYFVEEEVIEAMQSSDRFKKI